MAVRVRDVSTAGQARNLAPRGNHSQRERGGNHEANLNQLLGVNQNRQQVETEDLREGEVVRDVSHANKCCQWNSANSRLSEIFKNLFPSETAAALERIVNGSNPNLKASVLQLQAQTEGTMQVSENIIWAGKLISFVSGISTVKNPPNQDPSARELLHDMANNAGDAVSWSPQSRNNFFAIVKRVLETHNIHPSGLTGAFRDAVHETFNLTEEKVMDKLLRMRTELRYGTTAISFSGYFYEKTLH